MRKLSKEIKEGFESLVRDRESELSKHIVQLFSAQSLQGMGTVRLMEQLRQLPNVDSVRLVEGAVWITTKPMPVSFTYSYSIEVEDE